MKIFENQFAFIRADLRLRKFTGFIHPRFRVSASRSAWP